MEERGKEMGKNLISGALVAIAAGGAAAAMDDAGVMGLPSWGPLVVSLTAGVSVMLLPRWAPQ